MKVKVIRGVVIHNKKEYAVDKSFIVDKKNGERLINLGVAKEVMPVTPSNDNKIDTPDDNGVDTSDGNEPTPHGDE